MYVLEAFTCVFHLIHLVYHISFKKILGEDFLLRRFSFEKVCFEKISFEKIFLRRFLSRRFLSRRFVSKSEKLKKQIEQVHLAERAGCHYDLQTV